MRTKTITGILIILVLLLGGCDILQQTLGNDGEYTDVVYSIDSSGRTDITLYLDGVGVPVTRSQRALTRDLAVMSHDFFEVIFVNGDITTNNSTTARASWELGQNAGIVGVDRASPGRNYTAVTQTSNGPAAVIFVGRKSDKTLLGVGHLIHVDRAPTPDNAGTNDNLLLPTSKSVTFQVVAINTRLTAGGAGVATPQPGTLPLGSFWTGAAGTSGTGASAPTDSTNTVASWTGLDDVEYPMFNLPKFDTRAVGTATNFVVGLYKFFGPFKSIAANASEGRPIASIDMEDAIMVDRGTATAPLTPQIMKRDPRYLSGGQTWYVNNVRNDTATLVSFQDLTGQFGAAGAGPAFPHDGIKILFEIKQKSDGGVFSFTFQVPVYMLTKDEATNGGPKYETWYIRPGYGPTQYDLDNGVDAGGCVLMGVNVQGIDWLDIFTTGVGFY